MSEDKKQYEISYLIKTEADKSAVLKVLKEVMADNFQEGRLVEIKLSYPIKKQTSAFFGGISFSALPSAITEINNSLKFSEGVLRFLIVAPSAKKSHSRFDRKDETVEELSLVKNTKTEEVKNSKKEETAEPKEREELDDAAFNEKLEEILTNTQVK